MYVCSHVVMMMLMWSWSYRIGKQAGMGSVLHPYNIFCSVLYQAIGCWCGTSCLHCWAGQAKQKSKFPVSLQPDRTHRISVSLACTTSVHRFLVMLHKKKYPQLFYQDKYVKFNQQCQALIQNLQSCAI